MPPLPPLTAPVRLERHEPVPNDRLYLGFRLPPDATDEFLACALAVDVLGGLASSRLVERLVRTDRLATGLAAHPMGFSGGVSLGLVSVDVTAGVGAGRGGGGGLCGARPSSPPRAPRPRRWRPRWQPPSATGSPRWPPRTSGPTRSATTPRCTTTRHTSTPS